ncbi:MAG TPA: hypothetical protein VG222_17685, partial [Vicinamibacterales bacterium]|nr:hypothetical protein [Vicinamibacterales bacterium]
MDISGLEELRKNLRMSTGSFSKALAIAAGHLVDKPLRDIELHEIAIIYSACAEVAGDVNTEDANELRDLLGL